MKIFTQESAVQEVLESMETNLVKNASAEQQVETSHRYHAMELLGEAAELYESAGNIEKAAKLTDLMIRLSKDAQERDTSIVKKIAKIDSSIQKMQEVYESSDKDIDRYVLSSTANKITSILSRVIKTSSDINETLDILKNSYASTPKTLSVLDEVIKVADGTMAIVLDKPKSDDKKDSEGEDLVEVLKHFGFEGSDLDGLKADDSESNAEQEYEEYWEK